MFNAYNLQVYMPLSWLGSLYSWWKQNMVAVEMVLNLLDLNELIPEPKSPQESKIKRGEIEFKNVSFTYDTKLEKEDQIEIISNLNFKVK